MRTETDEDGREVVIDETTGRCLSVRVPLTLADAAPPPPQQLHRPGSLPLTDAQRQVRAIPYLAYRHRLSEAWRTAPKAMPTNGPQTPTADQARQQRDQRLADAWRVR